MFEIKLLLEFLLKQFFSCSNLQASHCQSSFFVKFKLSRSSWMSRRSTKWIANGNSLGLRLVESDSVQFETIWRNHDRPKDIMRR